MKPESVIDIPFTPVPKPRMTKRDRWKKRPIVERYYEFRDEVKSILRKTGFEPSDALHLTFRVPMPKSWSKKKREKMLGKFHKQRPDIDNYIKGFLDAAFKEDSGVCEVHALKVWSEKPGITVYNLYG